MEKRAFQKATLVGVFMLVVLVLVFLLVPGIAANDTPIKVGNFDTSDPQICVMVSYDGILIPLEEREGQVEIFIVETPNADAPNDIVALLRCEANLHNGEQYAITSSGASGVDCQIDLDKNDYDYATTTSWSQTISASGNAVLTCHSKRAAPF